MNNETIRIQNINERYSNLAESDCCLSCGGAVNYGEIQAGDICVDLGSGRGNDVIRMAEQSGEQGFAYGIDVSEGMIAKAKRNAEKLGVSNVDFLYSELEDIKLEDQKVNLVISNCTINHARDKAKVWSEIFRILKPGGRFVVSDIYSLSEVPEEYRNDPEAVAQCWAGAITRNEYFATVGQAGFTNVTVLEESLPYSKGEIEVVSFTIAGERALPQCSCKPR